MLEVTGVILAEGASRRFGEDKVRYPVDGRPMVGRVYEAVRGVVDEMLVSGAGFDIEDRYAGVGPIGGLHAALCEVETGWVLLVAADLPSLTSGVLREVISRRAGHVRAVVARTPDGRLQPLCACYRSDILPVVEDWDLASTARELPLHLAFIAFRFRRNCRYFYLIEKRKQANGHVAR